jgi:hypothetical protein
MASLLDVVAFVGSRVSARRPGCSSLFSGFACVASRVSARRPTYLSLLRQRNVSQRKATRVRVSLRCAKGNLRCSRRAGRLQTRYAQTCILLYRPAPALLGTRTREGEGTPPRFALGRNRHLSGSPLPLRWCKAPAAAPVPAPTPLCVRRAAQRCADQAVRLSEPAGRVCGQPALREQRRLPRSTAQGSQTPGSPFLWFVSFGDPKEMNSAAGPRPGLPRKQTH